MLLIVGSSAMTLLGFFLTAYEVIVMVKWIRAEKLKAIVTSVEGNGRQGGIVKYRYFVFIGTGPPREMVLKVILSNPIKLIFPGQDKGKTVIVRYDKNRGVLVQHISLTLFYLLVGALLALIGMLILNLLITSF